MKKQIGIGEIPALIPSVAQPIAQLDSYMLFMRWISILAVGIASLTNNFRGTVLLTPLWAFVAACLFNIILSIYVWQRRPLNNKSGHWLLLSDTIQAALFVATTGGYRSNYFIFFLLLVIELALFLHWRTALTALVMADALQVIVSISIADIGHDSIAGYIIVSKFIVLLIVGVVVIALGESIRKEEAMCEKTALAAARSAALNRIFTRLGESVLDLAHMLDAILEAIQTVPDVICGLVLLPDPKQRGWQVAASVGGINVPGKVIEHLPEENSDQQLFCAGAGCPIPIPTYILADDVSQIVGVYLPSPAGEVLGALMVGRHAFMPLSVDDLAFLRTLALEVSIALRNARLYANERRQIEQMQQFEARRSTFFSAASHELKTPLTVLKTLVPVLAQFDNIPEATRSEVVQTIENNLARLEKMVGDLLDGARLEAEAIALHKHPTHVSDHVQVVVGNLAPLLARKGQKVVTQAEDRLPAVNADGQRLEQILSNLIANAAKFAPPDSRIVVSVSLADVMVLVCVEDAGPGVPVAEREHIFEKFYILAAKDSALSGVGLGLFICRELVKLHGGRIWVEGQAGQNRFCFTLPIIQAEDIGRSRHGPAAHHSE